MKTDLYTIIKEIVDFISLNYGDCSVFELNTRYDIRFTSHGSDAMQIRHKNVVRMLAGGFLDEFYYENDTQHIYLKKSNNGLDPNDDRYSCLLDTIIRVNSDEKPCTEPNREIFVNLGDSFKRTFKH